MNVIISLFIRAEAGFADCQVSFSAPATDIARIKNEDFAFDKLSKSKYYPKDEGLVFYGRWVRQNGFPHFLSSAQSENHLYDCSELCATVWVDSRHNFSKHACILTT